MIPSLLRRAGAFRWYWVGQSVSLFGDQITTVALPLVAVLFLHATPADMGYLVAAAWLPYLLFALQAGALVDRHGHRRLVMIGADLGRAALLLTVPAAAALHQLTLIQVFAVIFLNGMLSVFFNVSSATLFVSMVRREDYVSGQSLLAGSRAFSFVGGPAVAGFLVQAFSGPIALVVDAASFLFSALTLGRIRPAEPPAARPQPGHFMSGMRFILGTPTMRSSLAATATINLFQLSYSALAILYLVRYLHISAGLLGVILGIGSIGGLVGSVVAGRLGRRIGVGPAYLAGCVIFTAPLVLTPLAGGPQALIMAMLLAAGFGAGFGVMVLDINVGAIFAALIPNRLRSRVSGAYTVVNYGVRPIGSVLGGVVASAIGVRQTLFIVTIAAMGGVLFLLPSPLRRMRDLPGPLESGQAAAV
ncbi:MAG TPA: MFS transporter [Candidatus Dormibacteraeota bacterium]